MTLNREARDKYFADNPGDAVATWVVAVGMAVTMFVGLLFWNAAITYFGWKWFITPLGLPQIDLLYALGLGTFISWFSGPKHVEEGEALKWLWVDIKRDAAILTVMWVVHFFI